MLDENSLLRALSDVDEDLLAGAVRRPRRRKGPGRLAPLIAACLCVALLTGAVVLGLGRRGLPAETPPAESTGEIQAQEQTQTLPQDSTGPTTGDPTEPTKEVIPVPENDENQDYFLEIRYQPEAWQMGGSGTATGAFTVVFRWYNGATYYFNSAACSLMERSGNTVRTESMGIYWETLLKISNLAEGLYNSLPISGSTSVTTPVIISIRGTSEGGFRVSALGGETFVASEAQADVIGAALGNLQSLLESTSVWQNLSGA